MQIRRNEYPEINEPYFLMISNLLSAFNNGKKNEREINLLNQIVNYVKMNFSDDSLSISVISAYMNMTENYISTFFKQHTGQNLSAYIEDIRMENAKKYIIETKMTMKEICEKVGYSNINTFYKAFKRRFGIPPKQFRQNTLD